MRMRKISKNKAISSNAVPDDQTVVGKNEKSNAPNEMMSAIIKPEVSLEYKTDKPRFNENCKKETAGSDQGEMPLNKFRKLEEKLNAMSDELSKKKEEFELAVKSANLTAKRKQELFEEAELRWEVENKSLKAMLVEQGRKSYVNKRIAYTKSLSDDLHDRGRLTRNLAGTRPIRTKEECVSISEGMTSSRSVSDLSNDTRTNNHGGCSSPISIDPSLSTFPVGTTRNMRSNSNISGPLTSIIDAQIMALQWKKRSFQLTYGEGYIPSKYAEESEYSDFEDTSSSDLSLSTLDEESTISTEHLGAAKKVAELWKTKANFYKKGNSTSSLNVTIPDNKDLTSFAKEKIETEVHVSDQMVVTNDSVKSDIATTSEIHAVDTDQTKEFKCIEKDKGKSLSTKKSFEADEMDPRRCNTECSIAEVSLSTSDGSSNLNEDEIGSDESTCSYDSNVSSECSFTENEKDWTSIYPVTQKEVDTWIMRKERKDESNHLRTDFGTGTEKTLFDNDISPEVKCATGVKSDPFDIATKKDIIPHSRVVNNIRVRLSSNCSSTSKAESTSYSPNELNSSFELPHDSVDRNLEVLRNCNITNDQETIESQGLGKTSLPKKNDSGTNILVIPSNKSSDQESKNTVVSKGLTTILESGLDTDVLAIPGSDSIDKEFTNEVVRNRVSECSNLDYNKVEKERDSDSRSDIDRNTIQSKREKDLLLGLSCATSFCSTSFAGKKDVSIPDYLPLHERELPRKVEILSEGSHVRDNVQDTILRKDVEDVSLKRGEEDTGPNLGTNASSAEVLAIKSDERNIYRNDIESGAKQKNFPRKGMDCSPESNLVVATGYRSHDPSSFQNEGDLQNVRKESNILKNVQDAENASLSEEETPSTARAEETEDILILSRRATDRGLDRNIDNDKISQDISFDYQEVKKDDEIGNQSNVGQDACQVLHGGLRTADVQFIQPSRTLPCKDIHFGDVLTSTGTLDTGQALFEVNAQVGNEHKESASLVSYKYHAREKVQLSYENMPVDEIDAKEELERSNQSWLSRLKYNNPINALPWRHFPNNEINSDISMPSKPCLNNELKPHMDNQIPTKNSSEGTPSQLTPHPDDAAMPKCNYDEVSDEIDSIAESFQSEFSTIVDDLKINSDISVPSKPCLSNELKPHMDNQISTKNSSEGTPSQLIPHPDDAAMLKYNSDNNYDGALDEIDSIAESFQSEFSTIVDDLQKVLESDNKLHDVTSNEIINKEYEFEQIHKGLHLKHFDITPSDNNPVETTNQQSLFLDPTEDNISFNGTSRLTTVSSVNDLSWLAMQEEEFMREEVFGETSEMKVNVLKFQQGRAPKPKDLRASLINGDDSNRNTKTKKKKRGQFTCGSAWLLNIICTISGTPEDRQKKLEHIKETVKHAKPHLENKQENETTGKITLRGFMPCKFGRIFQARPVQ